MSNCTVILIKTFLEIFLSSWVFVLYRSLPHHHNNLLCFISILLFGQHLGKVKLVLRLIFVSSFILVFQASRFPQYFPQKNFRRLFSSFPDFAIRSSVAGCHRCRSRKSSDSSRSPASSRPPSATAPTTFP